MKTSSKSSPINSLRELREQQNKTQAQVAKIMGVDDSVVSKIESKNIESLRIPTLKRYAEALKVKNITISFVFPDKSVYKIGEDGSNPRTRSLTLFSPRKPNTLGPLG